MKPIRTIVATRTLFASTSSSSRAEVARRGAPGRLRPGLTLLQVRLGRTQTLLSLHLSGKLAKGLANCQTFIVICPSRSEPRTTKTASTGGLLELFKLRGWDSNPQPFG